MTAPEEVLDAWNAGWSVIPVRRDKKPMVPWKPYQAKRPGREQLEAWAAQRPDGWAVVTGSVSGVVVLDFDGQAGLDLLERLRLSPHVQTGSGGRHVYVAHPGHLVPTVNGKSSQQLAAAWPGLDVRGDGGYAIFHGSNENGTYRSLRDLTPYSAAGISADLAKAVGLTEPDSAREGEVFACEAAPHGGTEALLLARALATAVPGNRNERGFWLACQLRDSGTSVQAARAVILDYCRSAAAMPGATHPYTEAEALATLRQAFDRHPRQPSARQEWLDDEEHETTALPKAYLRRKLKLPEIERVVRRSRSEALFDIELVDGTLIPLGKAEHVLNPKKVEASIADVTGTVIPSLSNNEFRAVAAALFAIAELEDSGMTQEAETLVWLEYHARWACGPLDLDDAEALWDALERNYPFTTTDGRLFVSLPRLLNDVRHRLRERVTPQELAARLQRLDFLKEQPSARMPGVASPRKRRMWASPAGFDPSEQL